MKQWMFRFFALLALISCVACMADQYEPPIPEEPIEPSPDYRLPMLGTFHFTSHDSGFSMAHGGSFDTTYTYTGSITMRDDSIIMFQTGVMRFISTLVDSLGNFHDVNPGPTFPSRGVSGGFIGLDSLHYVYDVWHLSYNGTYVIDGRRVQ